ncbi:MAG: cupredoxin domain-containing protein [bacterium]|nr:cupredoxin domain-containing protein [bacterium]
MNSQLKQTLPALAVVALIIIFGPKLMNSNSTAPTPHAPTIKEDSKGRTVMLHSSNWKFEPSVIRLKKGENVSLHLMGIEGDHGIAIPGLGIKETMAKGGMSLVKVPTDKAGTFEFFCNVQCGSGHSDMQGTIIIE